MSAQAEAYLSPAEYLAIEREAETKSEYFAGQMYAMTGAREPHNVITLNIGSELHSQFKGRPCRAYICDMRIKVEATGLYTYPDVVAICGELEFEDERHDTLLNPTVLGEVLSKSTERYDRGDKSEHYRRIESLQEYLLISQKKHHVEHFVRQPDDTWLLTEYNSLDDVFELSSIKCRLTLADIYDKVETGDE